VTITVDRTRLSTVDVFQNLDDAAIGQILGAAVRRQVKQGTPVFCQGDEAGAFYVLLDGRVKVGQVTPAGRQVTLHYIGPWQQFGCAALCNKPVYPGTALAVQDCDVLLWNRSVIPQLMERFPRFAMNVLDIMGARLQESHDQISDLSTQRVEQRIARALSRLIIQAGREIGEGIEINFPISRQDIAEMTGTTLHTASRTLSAWEEAGIVENGRRHVLIRRPHDLTAIAEAVISD